MACLDDMSIVEWSLAEKQVACLVWSLAWVQSEAPFPLLPTLPHTNLPSSFALQISPNIHLGDGPYLFNLPEEEWLLPLTPEFEPRPGPEWKSKLGVRQIQV